jgi:hypothetical protein
MCQTALSFFLHLVTIQFDGILSALFFQLHWFFQLTRLWFLTMAKCDSQMNKASPESVGKLGFSPQVRPLNDATLPAGSI